MKFLTIPLILLSITLLATGCGEKFALDYGNPEAQINEASLLTSGKSYLGKMVSVKGTVTRQDVSDPGNCMIHLGHSIRCNLGANKAMVESYQVGTTVIITGYLKSCEDGDILLEPAVGTDPNIEWNPVDETENTEDSEAQPAP